MSELEKVKEKINNTKDFINIKDIDSFLEANLEDKVSFDEYVECKRLILNHNRELVKRKKREVKSLEEIMTIKQEEETTTPDEITPKANVEESLIVKKAPQDYEELINKMSREESLISEVLPRLDEQSIKEIKLAIFRKILLIEKEIKESIIEDPSKTILPLQQKYLQLKHILRQVISYAKPKEENLITESTTQSKIKVFFLPNGKGSTYLAEDIERYIEKRWEIQNAVNKIVDGYFLKSKDTKPIKGTKEKLYEYTNPNGIRILFIVMKENTYAICGLFYKDKNKSTKITEYYEEAIRRFDREKTYLEENSQNPNFYIEQDELLGELCSILERTTPVKEVF